MKEELVSELEVSVYDTERNEKYRTLRRDLERKAVEEELRRSVCILRANRVWMARKYYAKIVFESRPHIQMAFK